MLRNLIKAGLCNVCSKESYTDAFCFEGDLWPLNSTGGIGVMSMAEAEVRDDLTSPLQTRL